MQKRHINISTGNIHISHLLLRLAFTDPLFLLGNFGIQIILMKIIIKKSQNIITFLRFDNQEEEAIKFHNSIFYEKPIQFMLKAIIIN
jgi:hypothetical protein